MNSIEVEQKIEEISKLLFEIVGVLNMEDHHIHPFVRVEYWDGTWMGETHPSLINIYGDNILLTHSFSCEKDSNTLENLLTKMYDHTKKELDLLIEDKCLSIN
jgi:hypothetical protein